uniref:WW domain-containing protein n=1 Tax=Trieres chinensis TaxID=1514140 RepID=A0A7S2ETL6_TRICV|mmetsp:Transcript_37925/g.77399  ORF Transcript_37925/g.77399 Transcript_37925/m.77399 type:complete len:359 (+) Transcript_37925:113-1189(+)|eukprot:CAMPEP_0183301640 /NCGR_PEP_ID=MMETSP0160_2-20130417/7682_1 /TAXON_ID=2839 ORGANISM="Odontella Sinensis, Strain Grunow 1884" /NCGR_SAMPLE_ID=MMETSP0160_2 /ASSEMBLY_ACC=CAM_ASM_000250 /LENGTH=358 /DNA_ID=CAMNT_0025464291 /DNA_START=29 /DNA_END=1105 /DNA_ORIENTATION=-
MATFRSFLSLGTIGARRFKPSPSSATATAGSAAASAAASRLLDSHPFGTAPSSSTADSDPPPTSSSKPSVSPDAVEAFQPGGRKRKDGDPSPQTKSLFARLRDKYSISAQRHRIELGERLFRAAQRRASDRTWHVDGRVPFDFRRRHALIALHVWFLHRRLIADRSEDSDLWLMVQEELFDALWNDSRARIRSEGVQEVTVNKHLKDVQSLTFKICTHLDHAFAEYAADMERRHEELVGVVWVHLLNRDEDVPRDAVVRLAAYVEFEFQNIMFLLPDEHFAEGRVAWGSTPDFSDMVDNEGKPLPPLEEDGKIGEGQLKLPTQLPKKWLEALTDAGDKYYWNVETMKSQWEEPTSETG